MKTKLLAVLGLVGILSACVVVFYEDMEVSWTVDGYDSVTSCSTYNVYKWVYSVNGPETGGGEVLCATEYWDSGSVLHGLAEGFYTVTVQAESAGGSILATRSQEVDVISGFGPYSVEFDFTADDFASTTGDAKINFYWNINGTQDGTPTGTSWDSCAEVGAESAVVTVDGVPTTNDCDASGNMSVAIGNLTADAHSVAVKLVDATGADITTTASGTVTATSSGGEFVADFYYDSFYEPKKTGTLGDYLFQTTFGGDTCSMATPAVAYQVVLLKLDGTPVSAQVCNSDFTNCKATDGADFKDCEDQDQAIPDQIWGEYKIKIQGTATTYEICWEAQENSSNELDILVGAGTSNPIDIFDLIRVSTSGDCA